MNSKYLGVLLLASMACAANSQYRQEPYKPKEQPKQQPKHKCLNPSCINIVREGQGYYSAKCCKEDKSRIKELNILRHTNKNLNTTSNG